jgi:hypothetical protein
MICPLKVFCAGFALALTIGTLSNPQAALASDSIGGLQSFDWVIQVQTEQVQDKFAYKACKLFPLDSVAVNYYSVVKPNDSVKYEKLWYHDGKPIGLERKHTLGIPQGDGVCIRIALNKSGRLEQSENKAAANAIMRLWLDTQVNPSPLVIVKVPATSFTSIVDVLQRDYHCSESTSKPNEQGSSNITKMRLESEPEGQSIKLQYN